MAQPARHRERAGKFQLPAIQGWGSEQKRQNSGQQWSKVGGGGSNQLPAAVAAGQKTSGRSPGKPNDNVYIEAFNSRVRQECLNASWFLSMVDARQRINEWRADYNECRPHSALGNLTPNAFAAQLKPTRKVA
ncbi:integrase core domain-containing protein [Albidovulum sediminis]|uniref:integrase core domain-containing protein n=1 Tax=Albidovulum sediminis TaxID=3066345 RepID=UPI003F6EDA47